MKGGGPAADDESASARAADDLLHRMLSGDPVDITAEIARQEDLGGDDRRLLANVGAVLGNAPRSVARPTDGIPEGAIIGGFRLLQRLGAGGMGAVYLAEQPGLDRLVAVKLLRASVVWSGEAAIRFEREARALARVSHPGIVRPVAFGEQDGVRYLAMEYVEGQDLSALLEEAKSSGKRIALPRILRWFATIAGALQAAHEAGVVHRDVKPSNIRIRRDGEPVLIDFGLVKVAADMTLTLTEEFRGSPRYASPEQLGFRGLSIDARSDVYSLGVALYEAVTGRPPFPGRTPEVVLPQVLAGAFDPPRQIARDIPREVEAVILKAIELDPAHRYQTAADFAADLDALVELRAPAIQPWGPRRRLRHWARRRPTAAALLTGVVLAVGVAVAWYSITSWREATRVHALLAHADAALGAGDLVAAQGALDDAARLRPDDPAVLQARARATTTARHLQAAELVRRAREAFTRFASSSAEVARIEERIEDLRVDMELRQLSTEERGLIERAGGASRSRRIEVEALFNETNGLATAALGLDPDSTLARATLAELAFERWTEASHAGDRLLAAQWAERVRGFDGDGRFVARIMRRFPLQFSSTPPGAEIHLFRYVEEREVRPDGGRRLIPVPWPGGETAIRPGTVCLRLLKAVAGLSRDDLLVSVGGFPVEGTVFALSRTPGESDLARVVAVDGTTPEDAWDALLHLQTPRDDGQTHEIIVEDERGRRTLTADNPFTSPIDFGNAEMAMKLRNARARAWKNGVLEDVTFPEGALTARTAAPLLLSSACLAGTTPTEPVTLDPGSWIAVASARNCETQRFPFVVEDGMPPDIHLTLLAAGSSPPWMSWVPPGPAKLGARSGYGRGQLPERVRQVPGFWIAQRESVLLDILGFLNDPDVPASLRTPPTTILSSGTNVQTMWERWLDRSDGTWHIRRNLENHPVNCLSLSQATAFAEWCTKRLRARSDPRTFAIPTDVEWERAARGVDGRDFPYGNTFSPGWQKTGSSRQKQFQEEFAQFPVDESVFGIYDLAGSMMEPVIPTESWDPDIAGSDADIVRGSPWSVRSPRKVWRSAWIATGSASVDVGLRLVLHTAR